jgi:hypothetical protein
VSAAKHHTLNVAILVSLVLIGSGLIMGGSALRDQASYTPLFSASNDRSVQISPNVNYILRSVGGITNKLPEEWTVNASFGFTGNSTTVVLDPNTGVIYSHGGMACVYIDVPRGPCGGGIGFRFILPPGSNRTVEVVVHNNDSSIETLNDSMVSLGYTVHPDAAIGSSVIYLGAGAVAVGILVFGWKEHLAERLGGWARQKPNWPWLE